MESAQTLLTAGQVYVWAGIAVAVVFLGWGLDRIEPKARGAWMFRPLLIPGVVLIWPLVLWRWLGLERGGGDPQRRHAPPRKTQAVLGLTLALAVPVMLFGALLLRQDGPMERPAVMIAPPGEAPDE